MAEDFSNPLLVYQKKIEEEIVKNISLFGKKTELRDACEYALLNGGKRFRPSLVFMVAKAIGNNTDVVQAALAVEYFHTASLIADDLPCMDDDDERRGKLALHKVYGEACALLCSYALISAGYECLTNNVDLIAKGNYSFSENADRLGILAIQNVSYNTGVFGATGGQYLDIFSKDTSLDVMKEVILKKTISLFEMSFVLGWLFGGGEIEKLESVKKAAAHFGMAFQIADDIEDVEQDISNEHKVNVAVNFGKKKAFEMIQEEVKSFFNVLGELRVDIGEFKGLARVLVKSVEGLV